MKKITFTLVFFAILFDAQAQIQSKISAFLQYHNTDSQTLKHRSREAFIRMNINTGEVKLTVPLHSFANADTALKNALQGTQSKMDLYFTIDGDPFLLHNNSKQDAAYDAVGMLHINNHYHHVKVRFSVFKKAAQPSTADLSYLISITFTFLPKHYELDKLNELVIQPVKISLYKQPYSFEHNTF
jgi:hypothetical protein